MINLKSGVYNENGRTVLVKNISSETERRKWIEIGTSQKNGKNSQDFISLKKASKKSNSLFRLVVSVNGKKTVYECPLSEVFKHETDAKRFFLFVSHVDVLSFKDSIRVGNEKVSEGGKNVFFTMSNPCSNHVLKAMEMSFLKMLESSIEFGVGDTYIVNPFSDKLTYWDKNRPHDDKDDSGRCCEQALQKAYSRHEALKKQIENDNAFYAPLMVPAWMTEDGKFMVGDANTRLSVHRELATEGKFIPGMNVFWKVETFNNRVNPHTGAYYTKEEFDSYCEHLNRIPNADWTFMDICDYYREHGNANAIFIYNTVEKYNGYFAYTNIADIGYGQGSTKAGGRNQIFVDDKPAWEKTWRFIDFMLKLKEAYGAKNPKNKDEIKSLTQIKVMQSFQKVYMIAEHYGCLDDFENYLLDQLPREKKPFVFCLSTNKLVNWHKSIIKFIRSAGPQNMKQAMCDVRKRLNAVFKENGVWDYYDENSEELARNFGQYDEYKVVG